MAVPKKMGEIVKGSAEMTGDRLIFLRFLFREMGDKRETLFRMGFGIIGAGQKKPAFTANRAFIMIGGRVRKKRELFWGMRQKVGGKVSKIPGFFWNCRFFVGRMSGQLRDKSGRIFDFQYDIM